MKTTLKLGFRRFSSSYYNSWLELLVIFAKSDILPPHVPCGPVGKGCLPKHIGEDQGWGRARGGWHYKAGQGRSLHFQPWGEHLVQLDLECKDFENTFNLLGYNISFVLGTDVINIALVAIHLCQTGYILYKSVPLGLPGMLCPLTNWWLRAWLAVALSL